MHIPNCQRGPSGWSEISSRGPYFFTKLVPGGGPNFSKGRGGSGGGVGGE